MASWTEHWENGFAALSKFRAREGHCFPSRHHVEGQFSLGAWVSTQRYYLKRKLLSAERKRRLDASARRGEGQSLTQRQALALAGEWYNWYVARHEENPGTLEHWRV
ncbi:MAG: helicase associated domain-containing protein, partial [Xanthobacteraceae bacterium]